MFALFCGKLQRLNTLGAISSPRFTFAPMQLQANIPSHVVGATRPLFRKGARHLHARQRVTLAERKKMKTASQVGESCADDPRKPCQKPTYERTQNKTTFETICMQKHRNANSFEDASSCQNLSETIFVRKISKHLWHDMKRS